VRVLWAVSRLAGRVRRGRTAAAVSCAVAPLLLAAVSSSPLAAGLVVGAAPAGALSSQQSRFLTLAEQGVAQAQSAFKDSSQGVWNGHRNVPLRWYDERLHHHVRYPLATIWGSVGLFEALSAVAIADPTPANRSALDAFAEGAHPASHPPGASTARITAARASKRHGRTGSGGGTLAVFSGAESYWDPAMRAFAPYPGDRGPANTWFDDNAWWGVAFMDAYRALGKPRLLMDAQAAFDFIASRGWDAAGGGLWWNTAHTPAGQKSGEALAAGSLLGALLAQAWQNAAQSAGGAVGQADHATAASDLQNVQKLLSWGDANFADPNGLYSRTQGDPTPMPYVAGPEIEAKELLCKLLPAANPYCAQAARLAGAAYQRFAYRLNMGPQFDAIYLHWMLVYGQQTGDGRWAPMALKFADDAQANSRDPSTGLYLKAWDGSDMSAHQAEPNMLRTDAATVELCGWLAADGS
jgi:Glycosyl hydrolase family 76